MTQLDASLLRGYLLGSASDEEADHIEEQYFARPEVLDQLTAVENDLIDEYVAGQLTPAEQELFDERYGDSPRRRLRVAVSRRLRAEARDSRLPVAIDSHKPPSTVTNVWPLVVGVGVAAAAIVAIAVNAWLVRPTLPTAPPTASTPATPPPIRSESERPSPSQPHVPPDTPSTPSVVALALSPLHVRTAAAPATLSIPPGADRVVVRLQGETNDGDLSGTAVVRTVAGSEVWRGEAVFEDGQPPDARVEIPALLLRVDDYVIELLGRDPAGREIERYSYFFSVRQSER
jgi:hypothetical protein